MITRSEAGNAADDEMRKLRSELGEARHQLQQREAALAALNRRLLVLERNQSGIDDTGRRASAGLETQLQSLAAENVALREEVERIYATKLFRVAAPARRVYGLLRGR